MSDILEMAYVAHDFLYKNNIYVIYQVVADSKFKCVLEIKDVPKLRDART